MRTIDIHAAKTHFSRLVEDAAQGEEIVIAKAGKPIARLVPLAVARPQRRLGGLRGKITIPEDFDAPLPDDILDGSKAASENLARHPHIVVGSGGTRPARRGNPHHNPLSCQRRTVQRCEHLGNRNQSGTASGRFHSRPRRNP